MLLRFLSYLSVLVWCAIAKGFFNLDEEFVVFLCLIIVFSTGIAALSDSITEYSSVKVEKLLGIHSRNWKQLLVILKKVKTISVENQETYSSLTLLTVKAAKIFLTLSAQNVVYTQMFYSLLVKEVLFVYENAEIKASSAYVTLLFKTFKSETLQTLQNNPVKFSFNTFKKVFEVLERQTSSQRKNQGSEFIFTNWADFFVEKITRSVFPDPNKLVTSLDGKEALRRTRLGLEIGSTLSNSIGKKKTSLDADIIMPKLDKPAAPFETLSDVMRKMELDPSYIHPAFIFEGDKAIKKANKIKKQSETSANADTKKSSKKKK
jgi:hypothetical protein